MTYSMQASTDEAEAVDTDRYDAIVVGAGVSGLYQVYRLREMGFSVRCFEEAGGVGGTWYWNRYPGCAFDSPSETYGYSFSEELIQEWDWKHYYSQQPEAEEYLNFVADKFDLRRDIQLNTRVTAARWDEDEHFWEVELQGGERVRASFLFAMIGIFTTGFTPPFEGADRFQGDSYHPSRWPREDPDLTGKRVAVIGSGATAIQLIPHIAAQCGHLTVFQRTANYGLPSGNGLVEPEVQKAWKTNQAAIHKQVRESLGIRVTPDPRSGRDVPKEERLALYEEAWKRRGFEKFMVLFQDMFTDRELLAEYSEFVSGKIRERVNDPVVAEKLVPKGHLIHAKRVPLETNYYETFNRENVLLVDARATPIECLTERGIKTSDRDYEFDVIIFATGFDSVTGGFKRIDIQGVGGRSLGDKWDQEGVTSYLWLTARGFPNLFTSSLPALCSAATICSEWHAAWFAECIQYMRDNGFTSIEPTQNAQDAWMEHVEEYGRSSIFGDAEYSWYVGSNVPGKKRQYLLYANTGPGWRDECFAVSENGYEGFELRRRTDRAEGQLEEAVRSAI